MSEVKEMTEITKSLRETVNQENDGKEKGKEKEKKKKLHVM